MANTVSENQGKYGKLYTDVELAEYLGISRQTIRDRRSRGEGELPNYIKMGRSVRTPQIEVDKFLDKHFINREETIGG